jgi:hypothetical protein
MNEHIVLLDPSLEDNEGRTSSNLGDCIIYEDVSEILKQLFNLEIIRISLHASIGKRERDLINEAKISFVGGSNILTSNILDRDYTRMLPGKNFFSLLRPKFGNIVLLGTGWCTYQRRPGPVTTNYYQNILHKEYFHSVRDQYSENRLRQALIKNVLDTGCPTIWELKDFPNTFNHDRQILFTLTDYDRNADADNALIRILLDAGTPGIRFFPQGKNDIKYLFSLGEYKKNPDKIKILQHDLNEFNAFIRAEKFNYIGTRLHGGIACLQQEMPTLILGIDNRALEMQKDFQLPVIKRNDLHSVEKWISGMHKFETIKIPEQKIRQWLEQFRHA